MTATGQETWTSPQAVAADMAREFREDAAKWTQGCPARTADGLEVAAENSRATCWCLRGAIDKRVYWASPLNEDVCRAFEAAICPMQAPDSEFAFVHWNDVPGRTVAEVIELCEKVAQS